MKILFVNEYINPVSGAEFSQVELAKAIKARVFSPKWFKSGSGRGISPLWFNNPIYYLYSAGQILRQNFDLIHVHGKYILPGAILAGWLARKPVIITVRDFKFLCPLGLCFINRKKCGWKYFIDQEIPEYINRYHGGSGTRLLLSKLWQYQLKWWLNRAGRIICVSPQLAKIYRDNGVTRAESIYNLPPEEQPQSRGEIVLSAGKLSYGKGTDSIIQAAKRLPEFKFVFVGELNPSLKPDWPPNCRYLGRVDHKAALKLYRQAAVFVINSRWPEPLSRASLEALSFGLPIVASNRGGNQEVVIDNGFLVDPDKPAEIAAAIQKAIINRKQLGQKSRKLLTERFSRRKILDEHINLYKSLIS